MRKTIIAIEPIKYKPVGQNGSFEKEVMIYDITNR